MNTKDFRIGNYYEPTDGSVDGFLSVVIEDLIAWDRGAIFGRPLLLTHEWIIRLGFQHIKTDLDWYRIKSHKGSSYFVISRIDFLWHYGFNKLDSFCYTHFKYVHQLQNLYYTLTGEELKIK